MRKIIGLIGLLVAFVVLVVLGYVYSPPPPAQAVVGELIIDQSISGSSTLGIITGQKFMDTASSTYFIDPAATGDALVIAGAASASGTFTVGNTKTIRSAFGPLQLDYKSGLNAWATGLTLQDTTGNVGLGTTVPGAKLDIYDANTTNLQARIRNATAQSTSNTAELLFSAVSGGTLYDRAKIAANSTNLGNFATALNIQTIDQSAGTWSSRMYIDAAGNVGIGTTAPGKTLSVNGTIESVTANAQILDGGGTSGQSATNAGGIEVFDEGIMTTNGQTIVWGPADPAQARAYMGSRLGGLWIIACYRDYWGSMSGWGTTWVYIFASGAWGGTTNSAALISSVGDTANCAVTLSGDTFTLTNNYPTGANVHYRATLYH